MENILLKLKLKMFDLAMYMCKPHWLTVLKSTYYYDWISHYYNVILRGGTVSLKCCLQPCISLL